MQQRYLHNAYLKTIINGIGDFIDRKCYFSNAYHFFFENRFKNLIAETEKK